jgi:transposase
MGRDILRDDQWGRIKGFLPGKASDRGVTASDNRLFVEAVLWIARTSSPWRDLPKRFGNWHRVYVRYDRWSKKGVWARLAEAVADPDFETLFVDLSIVRVHQHGAGKKRSRRASHRAQPGRPNDQNTRRRGCSGQSRPASFDRRAGVRIWSGERPHRRLQRRSCCCRQGL